MNGPFAPLNGNSDNNELLEQRILYYRRKHIEYSQRALSYLERLRSLQAIRQLRHLEQRSQDDA